MIQSTLSENLVTSYLGANYQIGTDTGSISLQINQYSEPLARLLTASKQPCAAIISAYNPFSRLLNDKENRALHESLMHFLSSCSYAMIESLNIDSAEVWPAEKSFFVLGLDLNTSKSLGQRFNQNAIVWIDNDAIPRLILLR